MCRRTCDLGDGPVTCYMNCRLQYAMLKTYRLPRQIRKQMLKFYLRRIHNGDILHVLAAELRATIL